MKINFQQDRPHPGYDPVKAKEWVATHGSGVAVVGIEVKDAKEAWEKATGVGEEGDDWAVSTGTYFDFRDSWSGVLPPTELKHENTKGSVVISEVIMLGDTVLRFIEYKDGYDGVFLPGYLLLPRYHIFSFQLCSDPRPESP